MVLTNSGVPKLQESTLKSMVDIYPGDLWTLHLKRIYETMKIEDNAAYNYLIHSIRPYHNEHHKNLLHSGLSVWAMLEAQVDHFQSSLPVQLQPTYSILLKSYRLDSILPINHDIVEALELEKKIDGTKKHDKFIDSIEEEISSEDPVLLMYCDNIFHKYEMKHRAGIRDVAFSMYALVHQVFADRWDCNNPTMKLLFEGLRHMDAEEFGRHRNPSYDLFSIS